MPACELGIVLAVVPDVLVVEPAVLVAVDVEPAALLGCAFVRMNDAPAIDPDDVRDAVPDVVVLPVVPVVLAVSPRCKQPATVIVAA